jgi:hypothetical protein
VGGEGEVERARPGGERGDSVDGADLIVQGGALRWGSKAFVEEILQGRRELFGPKRKKWVLLRMSCKSPLNEVL